MAVLLKAAVIPCSLAMLQTAADAPDAPAAHALLDFLVAVSRVEGGLHAILQVPPPAQSAALSNRPTPPAP